MMIKYRVSFSILFLILACSLSYAQAKKIKFDYDLVISFDKSTNVDSSYQANLRQEIKGVFNKERIQVVDSIDYSNYNEHYSTFILYIIDNSRGKISVNNLSASGNYTTSVLYPTISFNYETPKNIIKNVSSYIRKYLKR
jgi:hypothetical protein